MLVNYTTPNGRGARPALIVARFGGPQNLCNLIVFLDGENDRDLGGSSNTHTRWETSRPEGQPGEPGTWHHAS